MQKGRKRNDRDRCGSLYPVERTLLVSGMLESCLESKIRGSQPIETPHLNASSVSSAFIAVLST